MNAHSNPNTAVLWLALCLLASGCGGTKLLKNPRPAQLTAPLAVASDAQVNATLDWVIVRGGPGTWAKNADWDQYMITVQSRSDTPVTITSVIVFDSLDTAVETRTSRKALVKASKQTARRYKNSGLRVKAGAGAGTMIVAGTAVAAVGVGAAYASAYGAMLGGATTAGGTAAAAGGLVLFAPVLVVGGVLRAVNNSAVNDEIGKRQTTLPVELHDNEQTQLCVFYPLSPSPIRVELRYSDEYGEHVLTLDTRETLDGLHINRS